MKIYRFKALNNQGKLIRGHMVGQHAHDIIQRLRSMGFSPITCSLDLKDLFYPGKKRRLRYELINFYTYLGHLMCAGVTLADSLTHLHKSFNGPLRDVIERLKQDLHNGLSFSRAMESYPDIFDTITIALIRLSEQTGDVVTVIEALGRRCQNEQRYSEKIKRRLRYPLLVAFILALAAISMVKLVVPQLVSLLESLRVPLSWPTQSLMWVSALSSQNFLIATLGAIGLLIGYQGLNHQNPLRRHIQRLAFHIPLLGGLWHSRLMLHFFGCLSLMLHHRLDIIQSLSLASSSLQHPLLSQRLSDISKDVLRGFSFNQALERSSVLNAHLLPLVRIGEETGKLSQTLHHIEKILEHQVNQTLESLAAYIEPILLGFLGIIMMWILSGTLLPLYLNLDFFHETF